MSRKKMHKSARTRKKVTWTGKMEEFEEKRTNFSPNYETIRKKQIERQQRFLKIYNEVRDGNVAMACRMSGIGRYAVYKWMRTDPKFAKQMFIVEETMKDDVESQLHKLIQRGNPNCIMYWLDRKAKDRGYGESHKVEMDVTQKIPQERIDAIVRAHEKVIIANKKIPEKVLIHLENAKKSERIRLSEPIDVEAQDA